MEKYVHLHVHSQYSILDGQAAVPKLVDKALRDGMPGMALTDHGNMMGIKEFFNYVGKLKGKAKGALAEAEAKLAEAQPAEQEELRTARRAGGTATNHRKAATHPCIQTDIRLRNVRGP